MDNLQQPSVLAMPFANNGDKNVIPSSPTGTNKASLSEGFPQITSESIAEGGIPPERADFNALGNIATMFYYFMQCGGAYTFRADVSSSIGGYPKGALLWYIPATGIPNLLTSTINNNTRNFNTDQSVIGEAGSGKPWEIVTVSATNFMDLISNQTAAGEKTFTSIPTISHDAAALRLKNPNITKGTSPSSNKYGYVELFDKNGSGNSNRIGLLEFAQKPNGDSVSLLAAFKDVAGSTERAEIDIVQKRDGTAFATCPTPPAGDSSNKIVTTEWATNSCLRYPDYANRVSKDANTDYTAEFDGLLYVCGFTGGGTYYVTINGVKYRYLYHTSSGFSCGEVTFFLKAGDTFRADNSSNFEMYLIPYRQ